ncbi:hypothetical protein C8E89_11416 [Mycolicibacterium moriokaense]|uniref:Uncharacterized protein n=1 Tax=Mycolicibacterium moriokaense TaxID=39691 RepID=A0A318HCJ3_9MYCO|nr:hypothetical protein C8E89_11416 [Mycolicibacterium moriokaense]
MELPNHNPRRVVCVRLAAVSAALLVAGCSPGSPKNNETTAESTSTVTSTPAPSGMPAMPGMTEAMPAEHGLSATESGFTLVPGTTTIPANTPNTFTFRITRPDGAAVTQFVPEQTQLLHFYLIRADLTGFAHLHPSMAADGTWTATLPAMAPGDWRAYTQFTARHPSDVTVPLVLSTPLTVPGAASMQPIPAPSSTAAVDGYTVTLSGQPAAGQDSALTFAFSRDGQPVTDLQPYLDTYAHVTAIRAADLAFAHLHPQNPVNGDHGGPTLTVDAHFPDSGDWGLFIQFQTGGVLHTAEMTLPVG